MRRDGSKRVPYEHEARASRGIGRGRRRALWLVGSGAVAAFVVATAGYLILADRALAAARENRTWLTVLGAPLDHPIAARWIRRMSASAETPLSALLESTTYSRFLLLLSFVVLLAVAAILWPRTKALVTRYFTAETHPVDLAVFRIALFGFAAVMIPRDYLMRFASLPSDFVVPPAGSGWLLELLPVGVGTASVAYALFTAASVAAALGMATRVSAVAAVVSGIYVLGIPNFYGKVDHYNHLVSMMALMAVSPCADTLSIDALVRAWRRPGRGAALEPSRRYALPLRLTWLVIGVSYFFPGFWKIYEGGLAWALGDTFRSILHIQWASIPGFASPVALDRFPILYRSAASAAVAFELTFVFLLFVPRLRNVAVLLGLVFHNVTGLLMSIWFLHLQVCYVAFVGWHRHLSNIGTRLFPSSARLRFDPRDPFARRYVAMLRHLDVFGRIEYDPYDAASATAPGRSLRLHANGVVHRGPAVARAVLARAPAGIALWPTVLLLRMRDTPAYGAAGPEPSRTASLAAAGRRTAGAFFVPAVGLALLAANAAFGALQIEAGWPLASYPTFASVDEPVVDRLRAVRLEPSGATADVRLDPLISRFAYPKFVPLVRAAMREEDDGVRRANLQHLHARMVDALPDLDPDDRVRLVFERIRIDPADRSPHLVSRIDLGTFGGAR